MPEYPNPTTIRPTDEIKARVNYLMEQLDLPNFSSVVWHCINRVYREQQREQQLDAAAAERLPRKEQS